MTKVEKETAKKMLDNGCTYQEVAKHFGVSRQRVHALFPYISKRARHKAGEYNYIYPNVNKYMKDNKISLMEMYRKTGINYNQLHRIFYGESNPSKKTIDKLLDYTGMTYEEMFYQEAV